jgi:hypothetical protein
VEEQRSEWPEGHVRRLFNIAKRAGDWDPYKKALICHKKAN